MLQTSETARTAVSPNVHRASQSMPFGPSTIREGRTVTELLSHLATGSAVEPGVGNSPFPLDKMGVLSGQALELVAFEGVVLAVFDTCLDLALVAGRVGSITVP